MTESGLQKWAFKEGKALGVLMFKFSSPSRRGVPDALAIMPSGETIYIEFKSPKGTGRLSALQEATIARFKARGAAVYVVDSKELFFAAMAGHIEC